MFEEWKKKRRSTMIGYIIIGSIVGIDYSVILTTVFMYLRDVIGMSILRGLLVYINIY